jgi:hypothetical protein
MLQDGKTELVRYYCARRTKTELARPHIKPFVIYQRSVYESIKGTYPAASTYEIKALVGQQWRDMPAQAKAPFIDEAQRTNRLIRQRMATADPQQLLVRHEMWLQKAQIGVAAASSGTPARVLVHYLGDDAFQCLSKPPRPILVRIAYQKAGRTNGHCTALFDASKASDTIHPDDESASVRIAMCGIVAPTGGPPFVAPMTDSNSRTCSDTSISSESDSPPEKRRMQQHTSERVLAPANLWDGSAVVGLRPLPLRRMGMNTETRMLEDLLPSVSAPELKGTMRLLAAAEKVSGTYYGEMSLGRFGEIPTLAYENAPLAHAMPDVVATPMIKHDSSTWSNSPRNAMLPTPEV